MNLRKAIIVSFSTLFMVTVFSSSSFCWYAQYINIPYVSINASSNYWAGVAINNESDDDEYYDLKIYNSSGILVDSSSCNLIVAGGLETKLLGSWFGNDLPDGKYVLMIETHGESADRFSATLFMGNNGTSNPGFAFNTYRSENTEDYSHMVVICGFLL